MVGKKEMEWEFFNVYELEFPIIITKFTKLDS